MKRKETNIKASYTITCLYLDKEYVVKCNVLHVIHSSTKLLNYWQNTCLNSVLLARVEFGSNWYFSSNSNILEVHVWCTPEIK